MWELIVDELGKPVQRETYQTFEEAHTALDAVRRFHNRGKTISFIRNTDSGEMELA